MENCVVQEVASFSLILPILGNILPLCLFPEIELRNEGEDGFWEFGDLELFFLAPMTWHEDGGKVMKFSDMSCFLFYQSSAFIYSRLFFTNWYKSLLSHSILYHSPVVAFFPPKYHTRAQARSFTPKRSSNSKVKVYWPSQINTSTFGGCRTKFVCNFYTFLSMGVLTWEMRENFVREFSTKREKNTFFLYLLPIPKTILRQKYPRKISW